MRFQTPLVRATLLRRYKRFLADCRLEDGREITAHVANPGSMLGLAEPGTIAWLEPNEDPKKKLKWSWKIAELETGARVAVDTALANRIVREALEAKRIAGLDAYDSVRPEQKYGEASRIDFLLQAAGLPAAYVEVKSVTLSRTPGVAEFPDSVTARGTKHLKELGKIASVEGRAIMLYLVARDDAREVALAADIDPAYAKAFREARAAGVEVIALATKIGPDGIKTTTPLPFSEP
jgi:sugar fermentation stimulation protein A